MYEQDLFAGLKKLWTLQTGMRIPLELIAAKCSTALFPERFVPIGRNDSFSSPMIDGF